MKEQMIQELRQPLNRCLDTFLNEEANNIRRYFEMGDNSVRVRIQKSIENSREFQSVYNDSLKFLVVKIADKFFKNDVNNLLNDYFTRSKIETDSDIEKELILIFNKEFKEFIRRKIIYYVSRSFFYAFKDEIVLAYSHCARDIFKDSINENNELTGSYIYQHKSNLSAIKPVAVGLEKAIASIYQSTLGELSKYFYDDKIYYVFKIKLYRTIHLYIYEDVINMIKLDFFDAFLRGHSDELLASLKSDMKKIDALLRLGQVEAMIELYLAPKMTSLNEQAVEQLITVFIKGFGADFSPEQKKNITKAIDSLRSETYDYLYTKVTKLFIKHFILPRILRQTQGPMPERTMLKNIIEQIYQDYFLDIGYDMCPLDPAIVGSFTDAELQIEMDQYVYPEDYPEGISVRVECTVDGVLEYEVVCGEAPVIPYVTSKLQQYEAEVLPEVLAIVSSSASSEDISAPSSSLLAMTPSVTSISSHAEAVPLLDSSDETLSCGSESLSDESRSLSDDDSSKNTALAVSSCFSALYRSQSLLPSVEDFPELAAVLENTKTGTQENKLASNGIKQLLVSHNAGFEPESPAAASPGFF